MLSKIRITASNALSISLTDIYAWSDSTIVLCWLSTPPATLKSYVCNRVMDTVSRIPSTHWRHVPTDCNPADVASRGASPSELILHDLWWKGPPWLLESPSLWPCRTDWRNQKILTETKAAVLITSPPPEDITEDFPHTLTLKGFCHGVYILLLTAGYCLVPELSHHSCLRRNYRTQKLNW